MTGHCSTIIVISLLQFSSATSSFEETLQSQHYDETLPPIEDGKPVIITNQIYIVQLSDFRTDRFTYDIEYILRQWWNDKRLARNVSRKETTKVDHLKNDYFTYNRDVGIWRPRLSVTNSGTAQTKEDGRVDVQIDRSNGNVFRSARRNSR